MKSVRVRRLVATANVILMVLVAHRLLTRILLLVDSDIPDIMTNKLELNKVANVEMERKTGVINPHNYRLLINEPTFCSGSSVRLLVLVASSVSHIRERMAIRDTWGSRDHEDVRVLFLLAQDDQVPHDEVLQESNQHHDLIQEDFKDTYHNLTLKTMMGLKWSTQHCSQASYVMKTDDDIYVNLDLLLHYLDTSKPQRIVGCMKNRPNEAFMPIASMSNLNFKLPMAHPLFVAGAGYVLPGSKLSEVYSAALDTKLFPVEDVFITGHVARRVHLHPPVHDDRFSCGQMAMDLCELKQLFTSHKVSPHMMIKGHFGRHQCQ